MKARTLIFIIIYYTIAAFIAMQIRNYDQVIYIYGTIIGVIGSCIITNSISHGE